MNVSDKQQGQEQQADENDEYILPPRRLTGTTDEVLQQIDDLIQGLIGLQQLVLLRHSNAPKPETRRRLHLVRSLGALLFVLVAPPLARAQPAGPSSSFSQKPPESIPWQYGGFVDVAYLYDFDRPVNKVFRSRGTAWHVDDLHLNMTGAYAKKKATEESRWGAELLVQTGKDDEIFGFSATAPNIDGSEWLRHLGLANVSYQAPTGKGLTLQGGVFPSLIGYDSLYPKDNFNYTRPWGADFTPYLMLGVNASYPFTEKLTGTFYVVNGYPSQRSRTAGRRW